jgi:hypothetical protein
MQMEYLFDIFAYNILFSTRDTKSGTLSVSVRASKVFLKLRFLLLERRSCLFTSAFYFFAIPFKNITKCKQMLCILYHFLSDLRTFAENTC